MPLKHRSKYFKTKNARHWFSWFIAVCMSGIQLQLMMIQKTGNNVFVNVNGILTSVSKSTAGKRADHPAIFGIGQALIKVMQSVWGSTL